MKFRCMINSNEYNFTLQESDGQWQVSTDSGELNPDIVALSDNCFSLIQNGKSSIISFQKIDGKWLLQSDNKSFEVTVKDEKDMLLESFGVEVDSGSGSGEVHASIPGRLTQFFVNEGDSVQKGDKIFILEAMKMENEIASKIDGVVQKIYLEAGKTVDKNDLILEIE